MVPIRDLRYAGVEVVTSMQRVLRELQLETALDDLSEEIGQPRLCEQTRRAAAQLRENAVRRLATARVEAKARPRQKDAARSGPPWALERKAYQQEYQATMLRAYEEGR